MDTSGQTSFIPKKPLGGTMASRPAASYSLGFLNIIAIFILVVSLVFFGGAWFYQRVLIDEIERLCTTVSGAAGASAQRCGLKETIKKERENLPQDMIVLFQRLDNKFKIATDLLVKHNNILPVFTMLQELTLPTIYYNRFSFDSKGISLSGQASGYEDIAIQTKVFSDDKGRIQSFIFSDLNADNSGLVGFKLTMNLEPNLLVYRADNPTQTQ